MINQTTTNKTRKPYHKPEIERVRLVTEQTVLADCKVAGDTGPGYSNCENLSVPCSEQLS